MITNTDLVVGWCRYTRSTLLFRTRTMSGMSSRGGLSLFLDFSFSVSLWIFYSHVLKTLLKMICTYCNCPSMCALVEVETKDCKSSSYPASLSCYARMHVGRIWMDLFSFPRIFLSYQNVSILYIADQNIYQQIHKQEANSLKKHIQEAIRITNKQAERASWKKSKGQHQPPQPIKTDPRIFLAAGGGMHVSTPEKGGN